MATQGEIGISPTLCNDGKYRWTYEVNLYRNLTIFYDLIKVFMGILTGLFLFMMIVSLFRGMLDADWFASMAVGFIGIGVFMFVLCVVGYLIMAVGNDGKYAALFTMDETGVTHERMSKHVKRKDLIGNIATMACVVSDDYAMMGDAMLAASVSAWRSDYKSVRWIKTVRRRHLIKVNELLTKNRIYVENPADYDFVLQYIRQRCPRVRK